MLIATSGQFAEGLRERLARYAETAALDEIVDAGRGDAVTVLVTRGKLRVDRQLVESLPGLRKIIKAGSGLDTVDVAAAGERGVAVVATGGSAGSVADLAMALSFACLRHVGIFDRAVRAGAWHEKDRFVGSTFASRRVGIVGFGRIGQAFAAMARALGAEVRAWDRSIAAGAKAGICREAGVTACASLDRLLGDSDLVSLHLPHVPDTKGLIGRSEFGAMRPGTILVNTARAAVVDHDALVRALTDGPLAAAGLDVHYAEGKADADPLFALPNVVLTPHVGAQSAQAHEAIADRIVEEVASFAASIEEVSG